MEPVFEEKNMNNEQRINKLFLSSLKQNYQFLEIYKDYKAIKNLII